jgi:hypothetical protein
LEEPVLVQQLLFGVLSPCKEQQRVDTIDVGQGSMGNAYVLLQGNMQGKPSSTKVAESVQNMDQQYSRLSSLHLILQIKQAWFVQKIYSEQTRFVPDTTLVQLVNEF